MAHINMYTHLSCLIMVMFMMICTMFYNMHAGLAHFNVELCYVLISPRKSHSMYTFYGGVLNKLTLFAIDPIVMQLLLVFKCINPTSDLVEELAMIVQKSQSYFLFSINYTVYFIIIMIIMLNDMYYMNEMLRIPCNSLMNKLYDSVNVKCLCALLRISSFLKFWHFSLRVLRPKTALFFEFFSPNRCNVLLTHHTQIFFTNRMHIKVFFTHPKICPRCKKNHVDLFTF